jgi:hypothetical protein
MRKQMLAHIFGVLSIGVVGGIAGGCSTPVGSDADRMPANVSPAAESSGARADTTVIGGAGDSTAAGDTVVARGGGFIGSGH